MFSHLLRLFPATYRPAEDFFTEVFATLIRHHPPLLWAWLDLEAEGWRPWQPGARVEVATQVLLPQLEGHHSSSVVDFVFRRFREDGIDTLFLESKLGSSEGIEQLPRYADHLNRQAEGNRLLVYCTRDFDPRSLPGLKVTRWYTFYHVLNRPLPEPIQALAAEVRTFMTEHRMAMNNRLTPINLLAMSEAVPTFSLLWEVLYSLRGQLAQLAGSTTDSSSVFNELREHQRLSIRTKKGGKINALIGFDLNPELEVPLAVVYMEAWGLDEQINKRFRDAFERKPQNWEVLPRVGDWIGIARQSPITEILYGERGEEDRSHVEALRAFFEEEIKKAEAFKQEHRDELPWAR